VKIFRYFPVAFDSIFAHKLRSALTMLGIVIGVAAVLSTAGIGQGASAQITEQISSQGTNLLTISPGATTTGGVRTTGSASTLTVGDADALTDKTYHPDLAEVAASYTGNAQLVNGSTNTSGQVVGTTTAYSSIRNMEIATGNFLSDDDVLQLNHVIVLGANVSSDLFGQTNSVGQTVRINNEPFTVIGVLTESGGSGFGSLDDQSFVPLGVAQGRLFNAPRYRGEYTVSSISVSAIDETRVDAAMLQVEETLRLRHRLAADAENDFNIFNQASLLEVLSNITGTITLLLSGIGAVSLIVGGIGIMNIMLVTVTERTKEIGLRKALGAHDSDILFQFLVEALVLTVIGGVIGIGLSFGIAGLVSLVPNSTFRLVIPMSAIILALSVSAGSGLIFGLYPAMRATRLDPIDALRYE
jgi:putative ABC transport system permease protein